LWMFVFVSCVVFVAERLPFVLKIVGWALLGLFSEKGGDRGSLRPTRRADAGFRPMPYLHFDVRQATCEH
jgi:hypothetical protein